MLAAHQSYTTSVTQIFPSSQPGSEHNVSAKVKKNLVPTTPVKARPAMETTIKKTTLSSLINRNKRREAQIGRRKARHKRRLMEIASPLVSLGQPIWTCTNIIIYFMIILTLFSRFAHLEKSQPLHGKRYIDNINNIQSSHQVIFRSNSSSPNLFGRLFLPDKSKTKDCCPPDDRSLEKHSQLANLSIQESNSKGVGETNLENTFSGKESGEKNIGNDEKESDSKQKEMHKRQLGLSKKTNWLNQVLSLQRVNQNEEALNVSREVEISGRRSQKEEILKRLKRSSLQVEHNGATSLSSYSSDNNRQQVVITETGGTSTSTSASFYSSTSPYSNNYLTNNTRANFKLTNNNNNNFSSYDSTNSTNNNSTQVTLSEQQQIQEQAFQRRLMELKQKYMTNRAISDRAYYILLVIYSLFIIVGTISNSLICLTVILKPKILSPRNIFIVNLAGSDLLLCVFTMPFSFIEISMKMWQMGLIPCKLVAGLQATSIFVSTISITAIALDRYKVIVYPTHQESANGTRGAALLLASVWIGALVLSLPLFRFRTVEHLDLPHKYDTIKSIDFCVEAWPFPHGRGIYSVISMMFQYVLPITIVSVVYAKISDKLQKRLIRRQRLTQLECRQKRQLNLIRRTHTMLISVSLIFGLSWLPLNLLNVIGDFSDLFKGDDQLFRVVFAVCHLIGCSSACSNPILYGYLNENFRKEFHQVYTHHMHRLARLCRRLKNDDEEGYDDDEEEEIEEEEEDDDDDEDDYDDEDEDDYDESGEEYDDEEEENDDDDDNDNRQFYTKDSGNHPPVTPTSTINSSAFASDEFEKKENFKQLLKQCENKDDFNRNQSPTLRLESTILTATSGRHALPNCHLPSSLAASEETQRKCSLPLPNRNRETRHSSASLKNVDQVNDIDHSGPKMAQSCMLELAEGSDNINKGRKLFSIKNQVKRRANNNNSEFKAPELKLFPPSSATGTSQTSSGVANRDKMTTDIESSAVIRYSFQALSNSRQTLGKKMRFCLCISGDSLIESDAACGGSSGAGTSRSISKSPRRRKLRNNANDRGEVINKSNLVGGGSGGNEKIEGNSLGPIVVQSANKKRIKLRKRRHRRFIPQADCDCNCHKSVQNESPASAVNIHRDRRWSSNLLRASDKEHLEVNQKHRFEGQKRLSSGDTGHSINKDVVGYKERQGRRVWLRFFPGKQQERYIDCASSNTAIANGEQQCNGDKLTPIKSQQLTESITSGRVGGCREQSIKNKGKRRRKEMNEGDEEEGGGEEEEEVKGGDDDGNIYSDDNSNAVREQTKPLDADAQPPAHIITGKQKNKQQQQPLKEQVSSRKQHCANCKQGASKLNRKKRRTRPGRRKEGPSSRKFRLRENVERKVKESGGANNVGSGLRSETIFGGGSSKSKATSNAKTSYSNPNGGDGLGSTSKKDLKLAGEESATKRGGGSRIEGLKVEVGDSMDGGSKIASCYYLSVETARSRAGSDVSKEQSTELVVINGDIDVAELEIRARDSAATSSCRNSPSLYRSSFQKENGLEHKSTQSSIDIRSTMQNKINNMQSLTLYSSNTNNNSKSNNMDKNNLPLGDYNSRLRMQITTSESSMAVGQQANSTNSSAAPATGPNANVAKNGESTNVAKVGCECGSSAGCQMNYAQVKKEKEEEEEEERGGEEGLLVSCTVKTDIGSKHNSAARAIKPTSLNATESSIPFKLDSQRNNNSNNNNNNKNNNRTCVASETPAIVGETFSLSVLPDTLITDCLDARSNQLEQRALGHHRRHHIDDDETNSKTNLDEYFDDVCANKNGDENLSSRELVSSIERKKASSDTCTHSQQQLVRMANSLTHPSMNCPSSSLQSDSNSSSCACLHSPSSSCTCSIGSACRREANAANQLNEAITSGCGGGSSSTTSITNTTARSATMNRNNRTCVSISIIKNGVSNDQQLATINRERPHAFTAASTVATTTISTAAANILKSSKWRSSCTNSTMQVQEVRGIRSNKLQMVSSSLSALPSATVATATAATNTITVSAAQSLSIDSKTNASMNICQLLSASTSCSRSGSHSDSISSASNSVSTSIVETASSSTAATTTTTTTNNSISRSSLASNDDEYTSSLSAAGVAVPQTHLDSFASSSASLEVARVMANVPAFNNTAPTSRFPASPRMNKQSRRLSITSFATSTDLKLKSNEGDSNISLQPLNKQCNGCSTLSYSELVSSSVLTNTTSLFDKTSLSDCDNDHNTNGPNESTINNPQNKEETSSGKAKQILSSRSVLTGNNNLGVSNSSDSALWQRFGGNDALTKSQEDMIIAERKRF